jgi:hypothetical protein
VAGDFLLQRVHMRAHSFVYQAALPAINKRKVTKNEGAECITCGHMSIKDEERASSYIRYPEGDSWLLLSGDGSTKT